MTKKQKKNLIRIIIAVVLMVILEITEKLIPGFSEVKLLTKPLNFWLFFIPYVVIGYDILIKAGKGVINLKPFDENFFFLIATAGAIVLGEYTEGVAVMLFYQIGELFQGIAVGKSRKNISALMDIRPDYANLEKENGETETVEPDTVAVGSIIVVRPGEKIPLDVIVTE